MANLDDLDRESITEVSQDEGIELLRQIRLSRRTPTKKVSTRKPSTKQRHKKPPDVSAEQAEALLKILTGG